MTESKIVIGKPADLDRVMAVLIRGHGENGFLKVNPLKAIQEDVWPALNNDHGLIAFIESEAGEIEGLTLLRIGKMFYSDEDVLEEKIVYVPPEFRAAKGGRARRLCEFNKSLADKIGIPLLIGVISNERTKGKMRLYERIFGPPAGAFFLYGAKTGHTAEQGA